MAFSGMDKDERQASGLDFWRGLHWEKVLSFGILYLTIMLENVSVDVVEGARVKGVGLLGRSAPLLVAEPTRVAIRHGLAKLGPAADSARSRLRGRRRHAPWSVRQQSAPGVRCGHRTRVFLGGAIYRVSWAGEKSYGWVTSLLRSPQPVYEFTCRAQDNRVGITVGSCSLSLQLGVRCRLHFMTLATQPCSDTKSLGSVSLTISWHLRPKAVRVSVSAGSLGPGGMCASGTVSANAGVGAGATAH